MLPVSRISITMCYNRSRKIHLHPVYNFSFKPKKGWSPCLADYIIFATGRRPELSFTDPFIHKHLDELQQDGKLHLIGDVKNDLFRQASIAAGDGIRAAMEIFFNESNKQNRK